MKFRHDDNNDILTVNPRHCCYKDGKPPFPSGECGTVLYAMKEGMEIDDVVAQEPWELQVTIEKIVEYGDANVEIITTKSGEASKGKAVEKDKEVVKKVKDSSVTRKKFRTNNC